MSGLKFEGNARFRTMVRGVFRWGTLCGAFAMLVFVSGCPILQPGPCANDPCDDGLFCNGTETCTVDDEDATAFVCADGDAVVCDAGDVCDEDTDECITPDDPCDALDCDDSDECTDDSCVDGACVNDNNTAACDDGDACTEGDVCSDGTCAGTAMDCDDSDACTDDTCADGVCANTDVVCPDGETCVDGVCTSVCAADADCDDSDACTTDTCVAEACSNVAMDCDDGLVCTDDSCDAGACVNAAVTCAEGEICIEPDGCTTAIVCAADADCDDDDLCTTDTCSADLLCVFTAVDCDDSDACTVDACDAADGSCTNTAMVCDAGETCVAGTCTPTGAFVFTLEDDTLNGSAGDDVFTAGVGTLNPDDIAVGGGGTDTVNASIVGASSSLATLLQMSTVNFTTLNNSTFDAANCAAIGTYNADGASAGSLTLDNVEDGADFAMGSGFAFLLDAGLAGAGADFTLTLNGTAPGATFDNTAPGGLDMTIDVAADSTINCAVPGGDCFGVAGSVTVTGSGNLTIADVQATDLVADGGAWDVTDHTGTLTVQTDADVAVNLNFTAADELDGVDQVTIADTTDTNHIFVFGVDDGNVTVDISGIDADDICGDVQVDQGASNDDILTVILGGDGDGMGALDASAGTEFLNIVSGGTTANAIADVDTITGTAFVTESVTVTGTQDCDLGTVTTETFSSTGLAIGAGVTLTAGASMQIDTGGGDDDITGSAAVDLIDTGDGDDTIAGGASADTIDAGDGDNTVQGDAGDDVITVGTGNNTIVLVSTFGAGGNDSDDADTVTGFGSGDSIELDAGNGFADGTGDLTNNDAVTDDKIDIANDGTDTTIIIDTDTTGVLNPVTIVLLGVALTDADFTFDAATELLTAD